MQPFLNSINAGADEQRFLEASMAYVSGTPIMSNEEFDKLKQRLKVKITYFVASTKKENVIAVLVSRYYAQAHLL